ncbi:hypothetical protein CapIbe_011151 [Capra ibex]
MDAPWGTAPSARMFTRTQTEMVSNLEKPYSSHEHGGQTHCGCRRLRLTICPQTQGRSCSQGGKRAGEAQRDAWPC